MGRRAFKLWGLPVFEELFVRRAISFIVLQEMNIEPSVD